MTQRSPFAPLASVKLVQIVQITVPDLLFVVQMDRAILVALKHKLYNMIRIFILVCSAGSTYHEKCNKIRMGSLFFNLPYK